MKDFIGNTTFSGCWEENLDNCINVFRTLAVMCDIIEYNQLKSVPVMLGGDSWNFYSKQVRFCATFDEAMMKMRDWYNIYDRKSIILTKWQ